MNALILLRREARLLSNPQRVGVSQRYFKMGKGEYGEGDVFLGLSNPQMRQIAKKYRNLSLKDVQKLLNSKFHEERQIALFILVLKFDKSDSEKRAEIYNFYLKNAENVNNWDLVDLSSPKIAGKHLFDKDKSILYEFCNSDNLWKRRISIISTYYFISKKDFYDCLSISEILLNDKHDLIHKAVGWMLREIGKKDKAVLENFLKVHYKKMPRTMLRYAIEKFSEKRRQEYLLGRI